MSLINLESIKADDGYPKYMAGSMEPGAYIITNFISETTTLEEFEEKLTEVPQYQLHYGGRCCWTAFDVCLKKRNFDLLWHLCEKGGELVVNTKGQNYPPLIAIILKIEDEKEALKMVKKLVSYGALINVYVDSWIKTTPLSSALKKKKYQIARYLISQGAVVYPEIKGLVKVIYEDRFLLTKMILKNCHQQLPEELIELIAVNL
jgi:hypothetical protein